jgi:hypothetical protein
MQAIESFSAQFHRLAALNDDQRDATLDFTGHSPAYPVQTAALCWLGSAHGDRDENKDPVRS